MILDGIKLMVLGMGTVLVFLVVSSRRFWLLLPVLWKRRLPPRKRKPLQKPTMIS